MEGLKKSHLLIFGLRVEERVMINLNSLDAINQSPLRTYTHTLTHRRHEQKIEKQAKIARKAEKPL